jgi:DNA-binding transcriptional regulator YdaS (Cro superfamily)
MTPSDLKKKWKTQTAIAEALGVGQSAVAQWFIAKRVPILRQYQIERLTRGRLKADTK